MKTEPEKHYAAYMAVFFEGQEAFLNGEDLSACPYSGILFDRWVTGYHSTEENTKP